MLLDQTTFTIGPDSFVRIDEFVYDPNTGAGKLTASIGKGVFRFVSGKIAAAHPQDMTVKLPVATIGVRGTMVYGTTDENRAIVVLAGAGPDNNAGERTAGIDVITPEGTAEVRRPGYGAIIERGKPPVVLKLLPATVQSILAGVAPREPVQPVPLPPGVQAAALKAANARTANRASGQSTAAAAPSAATFAAGQSHSDQLGGPSQFAAQNAPIAFGPVPDEIATFAQMRTQTGIGTYAETNVPISNQQSSTVIGSYNFALTVNFSAQTLNFSFTVNAVDIPNRINISNVALSNSISYAGQPGSGQAADFSAGSVNCGSFAGTLCSGGFLLNNNHGIVANEAAHSVGIFPVDANDNFIPNGAASGGDRSPRH